MANLSSEPDDSDKPLFRSSSSFSESPREQHASSQRRTDIDGLRAVAVLSVIAFHFNPTWLPGGFTGVDIFFTISGYVNTASLIHGDLPLCEKTVRFFGRRMWRLAPALMVIVFTSMIFTNVFTPEYVPDLKGYYTAGLLGLFGLSNNYFASLQLDYFEHGHKNLSLNPFTHLWSLGVEEQFYILFPFVFGSALTLSANRSPLLVLIIFSVISAAVSFIMTNVNTQVAFYTLPSRFWELSLGTCAFYIPASMDILCSCSMTSGALNILLQITGSLLLFVSLVFTPSDSGFPFPGASLAVGGTICFIIAGNSPSAILNQCFSHRLMVYIGSLSYSLYLWHWPVLVFFRRTECLTSPCAISIAMVLVLSLSMLTYHAVEAPMSRNRPTETYKICGLIVPVLAITAATSWALGFQFGGALYTDARCMHTQFTVDPFQNNSANTSNENSANTSNEILELCPGAGSWQGSPLTWHPEHPSSCPMGFAWPREDGEQQNHSVIFIGDSAMAHIWLEVPKVCNKLWQVTRTQVRQPGVLGFGCGLPEYLGMEPAPVWVSPAPKSSVGPNYYGLDHPFCHDCVGCEAERGQCAIADTSEDGAMHFDLEYIGVEFTTDVEMPTTEANTTFGSVAIYIKKQREYFDAIFINSCAHDMEFEPDVFSTEDYAERVRNNLLALEGSAKMIVWVSCNHWMEDPRKPYSNSRGAQWNEAVWTMINEEVPAVAYFNVAKMSQIEAMHVDPVHLVPDYYNSLLDIMLNFVVSG